MAKDSVAKERAVHLAGFCADQVAILASQIDQISGVDEQHDDQLEGIVLNVEKHIQEATNLLAEVTGGMRYENAASTHMRRQMAHEEAGKSRGAPESDKDKGKEAKKEEKK